MNKTFEYSAAAGLSASGRVLANAAHAAAVVAGIGCLLAPHSAARFAFGAALLCWIAACYYAVRVEIDTRLFQALAGEAEDSGERLDSFLVQFGLRRPRAPRAAADRITGSLQHWRQLIAAFIAEAVALAAGIAGVLAGW